MLKASVGSDKNLTTEDAQSFIAFFDELIKSQPPILVYLVKHFISKGAPLGVTYPVLKTALYDILYQ